MCVCVCVCVCVCCCCCCFWGEGEGFGGSLQISDSIPVCLQHVRLRKVARVTESYHEFSFLLFCDKSVKGYVSNTETKIDGGCSSSD